MTSPAHQSGTDRIAEVARGLSSDIVVNVQGDEPEIEPETIDALIAHLEKFGQDDMATAATVFRGTMNPLDPNLVKVVLDENDRAIYFSRAPIPYRREADFTGNAAYYLHLGIYAYRRSFLLEFSVGHPRLWSRPKNSSNCVLEHGRSIFVLKIHRAAHGIDTPEQYADL